MNVLVFCVCTYLQFKLHQCYATKCNRIKFDYLPSEEQANSLSLVYTRTSLTNNGFPVFEDENKYGSYFTAEDSGFWYFSKGSIYYRTGFTGLFSETYVNLNKLDREGSTRLFLQFCPKKQRYKYRRGCYNSRRTGTSTIRCVQEKMPTPQPSTPKDREYQNRQNVSSLDGTDTSTALKVLAILIPLLLYCIHLCSSCIQSEKTSYSRITSKHAYAGKYIQSFINVSVSRLERNWLYIQSSQSRT